MTLSYAIRQGHRWLSIAFTVTVIANFILMVLWAAARLDRLCAAAAALSAPDHRPLYVRAALYSQTARRTGTLSGNVARLFPQGRFKRYLCEP